jgi:hypothetical protein
VVREPDVRLEHLPGVESAPIVVLDAGIRWADRDAVARIEPGAIRKDDERRLAALDERRRPCRRSGGVTGRVERGEQHVAESNLIAVAEHTIHLRLSPFGE